MRTTTQGIKCEGARLAGAKYGRFGTRYDVSRFYDNGFGPVWIYQDAGGLLGIVRAESWEDAYEIVQDEILDDADPEDLAKYEAEQMAEKRLKYPDKSDEEIYAWDAPDMSEGTGYRSNGSGSNPWNQTGAYQEDLNGSQLELLTYEHMEDLGIVLTWEEWS
jgi:hypothetical protein